MGALIVPLALIVLVVVTVAPVKAAPELPIVAACNVAAFNVPPAFTVPLSELTPLTLIVVNAPVLAVLAPIAPFT